ncbi:hypothetical protein PCASD_11944 [Puccinia coronata f. sp. avenae]|uniref:Uncharacterized protein n=1 Tax=Puccinia coronata f. sp. avenae TaxID=200324 RepID=A0A2N5UWF8_9BASI|nr:hypothetical protein PCASD_11944 [Puccinia coronata f. sp. avenae]
MVCARQPFDDLARISSYSNDRVNGLRNILPKSSNGRRAQTIHRHGKFSQK